MRSPFELDWQVDTGTEDAEDSDDGDGRRLFLIWAPINMEAVSRSRVYMRLTAWMPMSPAQKLLRLPSS